MRRGSSNTAVESRLTSGQHSSRHVMTIDQEELLFCYISIRSHHRMLPDSGRLTVHKNAQLFRCPCPRQYASAAYSRMASPVKLLLQRYAIGQGEDHGTVALSVDVVSAPR